MFNVRTAVTGVAAAFMVCGCASLGGGGSAPASGEPDYSGIQTRALRSAPQALQAQNDSRPLSELNTPDAIAARESEARNAPRGSRVAVSAAPAAARTAPVAVAKAASHQQVEGLQKGATVHLRDGATLRARPSQGSEMVSSSQGADLVLGPQIYNADGYWWYVTAGKDSGWLSQSDISR